MATNGILNAALAYHEAGYNLVPLLPREKTAAQPWQRWQRKPQPTSWVERTFANHDGNLAALGGVTCIPNGRRFPWYLDCDEPTTWAELAPELRTRKVRTVRGGNAWYVSSKPVRTQKHAGFEIRGAKAYVMAPPSTHPTGLVYQFVDVDEPVALVDELPFCELTFDDIPETYHTALPRLAQRILRSDTATLARYPTRSEIDGALVLSLVNAGRDFAQIMAIMDGATYPSHYRSLPESRRFGWLLGCYEKCRALGDTPEWQASQASLTAFRAYVVNLAPSRITTARTGVVDKRALLAHVSAAQAAGANDYHLSARDGSEAAQVTPETFGLATRRLAFHGWLEKSNDSTLTLAGRYRLAGERANSVHSHTGQVVWECTEFDAQSVTAHDETGVFEYGRRNRDGERKGGLGRGPGETYGWIVRFHGSDIPELAAVTGFTRQTVRRHVLRLATVGLVDVDGDTVMVGEFDAETAGALLGTLGIGVLRRARHERQRAAWRNHFAKGVQDGDTKTDDTT